MSFEIGLYMRANIDLILQMNIIPLNKICDSRANKKSTFFYTEISRIGEFESFAIHFGIIIKKNKFLISSLYAIYIQSWLISLMTSSTCW